MIQTFFNQENWQNFTLFQIQHVDIAELKDFLRYIAELQGFFRYFRTQGIFFRRRDFVSERVDAARTEPQRGHLGLQADPLRPRRPPVQPESQIQVNFDSEILLNFRRIISFLSNF